jgi:CRISPR-associated protein Csy1
MDNQTEAAIACYQAVLTQHPDHLAAALGARLTLPLIYDSAAAVRTARGGIESGLRALLDELPRFQQRPARECFEHLFRVNFFLAYQGDDDTILQGLYGDFVASLTGAHLPALSQTLARADTRGRRIRIGFVSGYFRQCTVGGYFRRWITHLNQTRCETFVFHSSPRRDAMTREIATQTDHFVDLAAFGSLEACAMRIRAEKPDILIYPELGMDPHSFLLASLRLAPVQCAAWGHPVTSGLPTIDYFLSSRAAEPPDAAAHYHEKLVLLDGLGVSYPRPICPHAKNRGDFGLPETKTLYLCPQSLIKLHPDFDPLLVRVLLNDAEGVLVLFEADKPALTGAFLARLRRVFGQHGLDVAQRVVMLPYLRHPDFLAVNRLCDVMLDPPYWSGGNTALDALASGLPIVTFEGRFMRGRQSAAMLRQLGLDQLIAADGEDYVRIAHAVVHDRLWREQVRQQLRERADVLFDQAGAIASLERFLLQVAHA